MDIRNLGTWQYLWGAEGRARGTAIDVYIPQQHMGVRGLDSVAQGEFIEGKRRNGVLIAFGCKRKSQVWLKQMGFYSRRTRSLASALSWCRNLSNLCLPLAPTQMFAGGNSRHIVCILGGRREKGANYQENKTLLGTPQLTPVCISLIRTSSVTYLGWTTVRGTENGGGGCLATQ